MIEVTEEAIGRIREVMAKENIQGGLRIGVQGGGCSGLSYVIRFEQEPGPADKVFDYDGARVFIDPKSYRYLDGMRVDWKHTLMEQGFVFDNPNAQKSCGCGTSFTPIKL